MLTALGVAVLVVGISVPLLRARPPLPQSNQSAPVTQPSASALTLDGLIQLIKKIKGDPQAVASAIAGGSVDFELDEKAEKKLRKAGADDELLADIWKVTPMASDTCPSLA